MAGSASLGVREARLWSADFQFPASDLQLDYSDFVQCGHNLAALARLRQDKRAPHRLSVDRIAATFGADGTRVPGLLPADFAHLQRFATHGIDLFLPRTFVRCPRPPPLRTKYKLVAPAVNKLVHAQHSEGTVVLLPLAAALQIPEIHFSAQHWTVKRGKPQGRIICDVANSDAPPATPLNGREEEGERAELRDRIEAHWGTISHPTLHSLMCMVSAAADEHGWDSILLWKKDLQGAFNLLWFAPTMVHLLAFLLTNDVVVIHLAGMFGWVGMPFAFEVITRCLRILVAAVISGRSAMYVDDLMAVSHRSRLHSDTSAADHAICGLLGPSAVAAGKDESGRALDWIGWHVNLDTKCVTLSQRNLCLTTYAFFSFDLEQRLTLSQVQRMASLASRCSLLARQMRPYTKALYDCASLYASSHIARRLSGPATSDVCMWRAFLVAAHFDCERLARPIVSFLPRAASVRMEYDASLTAFAVGVSVLDGARVRLLAFAALASPFPATEESRLQNTYEFLAVVLGLLLARRCRLANFSYDLLGDNVSSLRWASTDRAASSLARTANIALTVLASDIDAVVASTIHVPGVDNVTYDRLSRGASALDVGLDPTLQVHLPSHHPIAQYIALCNPLTDVPTATAHLQLTAALGVILADPSFYS